MSVMPISRRFYEECCEISFKHLQLVLTIDDSPASKAPGSGDKTTLDELLSLPESLLSKTRCMTFDIASFSRGSFLDQAVVKMCD